MAEDNPVLAAVLRQAEKRHQREMKRSKGKCDRTIRSYVKLQPSQLPVPGSSMDLQERLWEERDSVLAAESAALAQGKELREYFEKNLSAPLKPESEKWFVTMAAAIRDQQLRQVTEKQRLLDDYFATRRAIYDARKRGDDAAATAAANAFFKRPAIS